MIKAEQRLRKFFLLISAAMFTLPGMLLGEGKLNVHGYLNQAFAIAIDREYLGIPEEGTFDYRNLALQFRYDAGEENTFVVQFSHRRLGTSPVMEVEEEVVLDWAFYEYHFNQQTFFRAGKIQVPFGIYNELRDVGTLLPFYKIPIALYGEARYVSETVDGLALSHTFRRSSPWEIKIDIYGGHWSLFEWQKTPNGSGPPTVTFGYPHMENALGGQLWLSPPLDWLRLGLGGFRGHVKGGLTFGEDGLVGERTARAFVASGEASQDRFYLRAELAQYRFSGMGTYVSTGYWNGGFNLWPSLQINYQFEALDLKRLGTMVPFIPDNRTYKLTREHTLGVVYTFSSNWIGKAEMHWNDSYDINSGFMNILTAEPRPARFFITSIAVSF